MAVVSVGSNPGQCAAGRLDAMVTLLYVSLMIPNEDETVDCMGLSFKNVRKGSFLKCVRS